MIGNENLNGNVNVNVEANNATGNGGTGTGTGTGTQLRNRMSGQCLATAADSEVYTGPLTGGRHTAVLLNRGETTMDISLDLDLLWSSRPPSDTTATATVNANRTGGLLKMRVRDILAHQDLGVFVGNFTVSVQPHAVAHVVLSADSG